MRSMPFSRIPSPMGLFSGLRVVLWYAVFSTFWIITTDLLVQWWSGGSFNEFWLSSLKGILFVACTSLLLAFFLRREFLTRLRSNEQVQESAEQFQTLLEMSADGILILDGEGRIRSANPAARGIFQNVGTHVVGLALDLPANPGEPFEIRLPDEQAQVRTFEVRLSEITLRNERAFLASLRDVTARKRSLQQLLQSQTEIRNQFLELEQIYRFAPVGLFVTDEKLRFLRINEILAESNGFPVEYHLGQTVFDILPELEFQLAPVFEAVLGRGEAVLGIEITGLPDPSGMHQYWLGNYFPQRSENGKIIGVIGAVIDISTRKHAEEKLRMVNRQLTDVRTALDQTSLVFITQPDGTITEINDKYCRLTGFRRDEILGLNPRVLNSGKHPPDFFHEMWQTISNGNVWHGEICNQTRDGRFFWVDATCVPVLDVNQRPVQFISIMNDITERKMSEQVFQNIVTGVSVKIGPAFFDSLVANLAQAVGCDGAFISAVSNVNPNIHQVISATKSGVPYHDLEAVILERDRCALCSERNSSECLMKECPEPNPGQPLVEALNARALFCRQLLDYDGQVVGILGVSNSKRMEFDSRARATVGIFAAQAEVELERRRISSDLKRLNEDLERRVTERTLELETANLELTALTGFQQTIFDSSSYGIITTDEKGIIRLFNRAAERILGYAAEDLVDIHTPLVFHDLDEMEKRAATLSEMIGTPVSPDFSVFRTILETGRMADMEWTCIRKDGASFPAQLSLTQLKADGKKLTGGLGILTDITDQKRAQELLLRQSAEMNRTNLALMRVSRLKDEFIASVSHELRTPLNAILGLSESIREGIYGPANERQLRAISTIEESGFHLLNLINDILDLSKAESGKLEPFYSEFKVRDACQSVIRLVSEGALKKKIKLTVHIDPELITLVSDERRVKQILVNLLGNAVKFTPPNRNVGLTVSISPDRKEAVFQVWDEGIGIPAEKIPNLFQPFVQLDSRLSRQFGGTGLGLSLVDSLSRLLEGRVEVESQVNVGSRFTVILPLDRKTNAKLPAGKPEETRRTEIGTLDSIGRTRLLLAEDNEENILVISDYLISKGFEVVVASDGETALRLARETLPNIILMDVQMPKMDGLECTRRLRAEPPTAVIPIVALTAMAQSGDRDKCLAAGMNAFVTKPVRLRELLDTILEHLPTG